MGRIAVVGLGLIGGSVAAALKRAGHHVCGFDENSETAEVAHELALIHELATTLRSAVAGAEMVVVAVPIAAVPHVVAEIDETAESGATVLDTASVKDSVIEAMERLPHAERFVGGHPMAGTESAGPQSARADLFQKRPFALVPSSRTTSEALLAARRLVESLGAYPLVLEAALHDEIVARTSHMPYLASTALALSCEPGDYRLAGPGLHDMLRLASGDRGMWHDIAVENREPILSALAHYRKNLDEVMQALDEGRWDDFDSLLLRGQEAASNIRRPTT